MNIGRKIGKLIAITVLATLTANTSLATENCDNEHLTILESVRNIPFSASESFKPKQESDEKYQTPTIWSYSAYMFTLVALYEKSERLDALDKLATYIDAFLPYTINSLGYTDEVRKTSNIDAWGTRGYLCNTYTAQVVHTGALTTPVAFYIYSVLKNPHRFPTSSSRYNKAIEYLDAVDRAVNVHKGEFIPLDNGTGYYERAKRAVTIVNPNCDKYNFKEEEKIYHGPLPYNQMLALGRTHIYLSEIYKLDTNNLKNEEKANHHLNIATRLAKYFKKALKPSGDIFKWDYNPYSENALKAPREEDFSHGSIDIRFVNEAFRFGIYFTQKDLIRLANSFKLATSDKNNIKSHIHVDKINSKHTEEQRVKAENRARKAAARWLDLSLVAPEIHPIARDIFYNSSDIDKRYHGDTVLGRALLYKWRPSDQLEFPTNASNLKNTDKKDYLYSYKPKSSISLAGWSGLYREPSTKVEYLNHKSVTSCVGYQFEKTNELPVRIRYRHTKEAINGDSCSGSACGSAPGALLFARKNSSDNWNFKAALELEHNDERYRTSTLNNLGENKEMAICRSGAGHARNNLQINYIGRMENQCYSEHDDGTLKELFPFQSESLGDWTTSTCRGYENTSSKDFSLDGNKSFKIQETEGANFQCNPAHQANLELAVSKSVPITAESITISGWNRIVSDYSGEGKVNNFCVGIVDPRTNLPVDRICKEFTSNNDSGWQYFDYDISKKIKEQDLSEVIVVLGSFDSWKKNWKQSVYLRNVQIRQDVIAPNPQ